MITGTVTGSNNVPWKIISNKLYLQSMFCILKSHCTDSFGGQWAGKGSKFKQQSSETQLLLTPDIHVTCDEGNRHLTEYGNSNVCIFQIQSCSCQSLKPWQQQPVRWWFNFTLKLHWKMLLWIQSNIREYLQSIEVYIQIVLKLNWVGG
jgi:hypothetical protein